MTIKVCSSKLDLELFILVIQDVEAKVYNALCPLYEATYEQVLSFYIKIHELILVTFFILYFISNGFSKATKTVF